MLMVRDVSKNPIITIEGQKVQNEGPESPESPDSSFFSEKDLNPSSEKHKKMFRSDETKV